MKKLTILFSILLLFSCKKDESFDAKVEAYFNTSNNYKVLSPTSIQIDGELVMTTEGTFKSHGVVWSETNMEPTLNDQFTDLGEITSSAKFTSTIEGLEYGKLYYYRSYAHAGKDRIFYSKTYIASTAWQLVESPTTTGLRDGVTLVIGDKAYLGLGSDSYQFDRAGNVRSIWEFNSSAKIWTEKKPFPGGGREEAFSFVINGKGYVGGGFTGSFINSFDCSISYNDFWEYDPAMDQWTLKGQLPANLHRIGFTIGDYGYSFNKTNFARFDPVANEWSMIPFNFENRDYATSFVLNGKAYLVGGMNKSNLILSNEVLEFDPFNQIWTKKKDFPVGVAEAISFVINGQVYVGTGVKCYGRNCNPSLPHPDHPPG